MRRMGRPDAFDRSVLQRLLTASTALAPHPLAVPQPDGVQHAKEALRNADAVCFDVDSTVTQDEGIDELALAHGEEVYQAVKAVTDA